MSIEINGLPPSIAGAGGNAGAAQPNEQAAQQATSGSVAASAADKVSLTSGAQQLQELGNEVGKLPVVDSQRVEDVKEALSNGTFQVDASRVADKMMSLERAIGDMG